MEQLPFSKYSVVQYFKHFKYLLHKSNVPVRSYFEPFHIQAIFTKYLPEKCPAPALSNNSMEAKKFALSYGQECFNISQK